MCCIPACLCLKVKGRELCMIFLRTVFLVSSQVVPGGLSLYPAFPRVGFASCPPALPFGVPAHSQGAARGHQQLLIQGCGRGVLCAGLCCSRCTQRAPDSKHRRVSEAICVTQLMAQPGDMSRCDSQPQGGTRHRESCWIFSFPWEVLAGCCC